MRIPGKNGMWAEGPRVGCSGSAGETASARDRTQPLKRPVSLEAQGSSLTARRLLGREAEADAGRVTGRGQAGTSRRRRPAH